MTKKSIKRRSYTEEFKTEAVALAEKREKPISRLAQDLGLNESMLRRWIAQTRGASNPQAAGAGMKAFPGHGRPRDAELIRLRKEVKALKNANEILKKAAAIFATEEPL